MAIIVYDFRVLAKFLEGDSVKKFNSDTQIKITGRMFESELDLAQGDKEFVIDERKLGIKNLAEQLLELNRLAKHGHEIVFTEKGLDEGLAILKRVIDYSQELGVDVTALISKLTFTAYDKDGHFEILGPSNEGNHDLYTLFKRNNLLTDADLTDTEKSSGELYKAMRINIALAASHNDLCDKNGNYYELLMKVFNFSDPRLVNVTVVHFNPSVLKNAHDRGHYCVAVLDKKTWDSACKDKDISPLSLPIERFDSPEQALKDVGDHLKKLNAEGSLYERLEKCIKNAATKLSPDAQQSITNLLQAYAQFPEESDRVKHLLATLLPDGILYQEVTRNSSEQEVSLTDKEASSDVKTAELGKFREFLSSLCSLLGSKKNLSRMLIKDIEEYHTVRVTGAASPSSSSSASSSSESAYAAATTAPSSKKEEKSDEKASAGASSSTTKKDQEPSAHAAYVQRAGVGQTAASPSTLAADASYSSSSSSTVTLATGASSSSSSSSSTSGTTPGKTNTLKKT